MSPHHLTPQWASRQIQASGAKDLHIDDATKRSKLLELPPRYNKIVELIEDLEQERVLRDEEPYTCDQIEHKILTWEDTTKHRKFLDKKVAEEIKRRKKAKRLNHESRANVANSKQKQQGQRKWLRNIRGTWWQGTQHKIDSRWTKTKHNRRRTQRL